MAQPSSRMNEMSKEAQARVKINKLLESSGWRFFDSNEGKANIALEPNVSLPAGVFNPYSGVKTSILILDKRLHKQLDSVLFVKVGNDGFNLGAQRRMVVNSDLPEATRLLRNWMTAPKEFEGDGAMAQAVKRAKLAGNGDFNLSGERYITAVANVSQKWPMVELGKFARSINGRAYKQEELLHEGPTPVLRVGNFFSNRSWYYSDLTLDDDKYCNAGDLLYAWSASFGPRIWEGPKAIFHYHIWKIETTDAIDKRFLFQLLESDSENIKAEGNGIAMTHATKGGMEQRKFPLPPLDVQHQIVAEIEGYQKIIDGARQVLGNYRPHIVVNPDWETKRLSEITECVSVGDHQAPPKSDEGVPFVTISNIDQDNRLDFTKTFFVPQTYFDQLGPTRRPQKNDTLYSVTGSFGIPVFVGTDKEFCFQRHIALIRPAPVVDAKYL